MEGEAGREGGKGRERKARRGKVDSSGGGRDSSGSGGDGGGGLRGGGSGGGGCEDTFTF